jgi:hypothetical protein
MAAKDYTGQVFGSLTALHRLDRVNASGSYYWKFQCVCGNTYENAAAAVASVSKSAKNPQTPSCGCMLSDIAKATAKRTHTVHGFNRKDNTHKLYSVRRSIIDRCYNPNNSSYINYGAKGVTVCQEWLDDPAVFINWCLDNGWHPGLEIDKDIKIPGNKHYSPDTCLIVTKLENNRGSHMREVAYGKSKSVLLSPAQVEQILEKYSTGDYSQYDLANEYNITRSAIQRLVNIAGITRSKKIKGN